MPGRWLLLRLRLLGRLVPRQHGGQHQELGLRGLPERRFVEETQQLGAKHRREVPTYEVHTDDGAVGVAHEQQRAQLVHAHHLLCAPPWWVGRG